MANTTVLVELQKFQNLCARLLDENPSARMIDEYGCVVHGHSEGHLSLHIDLLITGLVHGDEIIGLEVINQCLEEICSRTLKWNVSVGFLLCNVDAARAGLRFEETDLNRSFLVEHAVTKEQHRAAVIGQVIRNAGFILDLHQTVEPTESLFFVLPHHEHLIRKTHRVVPEIPIVTFPVEGFSIQGKTMLEYAAACNINAIGLECGQVGWSSEVTRQVVRIIDRLVARLFTGSEHKKESVFSIEVVRLSDWVPNSGSSVLVPGLRNFMLIRRGQILGYDNDQPILAPFDGRLFFPKYGDLAKVSPELCDLGQIEVLRIDTHFG